MTIALSTSTPVQYLGNGTTVTYTYPWKIFATTDLLVGFIVGGVYTQQATGFTVAGVGVNGGGSITFATAPPVGTTIDLRTEVPEIQPTEFANLTAYLPENTTNAMDRVTRALQDAFRLAYTYSIHASDNESVPWTSLPGPATRANTALSFDSNGLPTVAALLPTALTQTQFNAFLLSAPTQPIARTSAEIAAGVNPVNFSYPPCYVDRYVSNTTPGVTDTSSGFSAAFKVAQLGGYSAVRYGATAPYATTNPINFTSTGLVNLRGVTLRCEAGPGKDAGTGNLNFSLIINHTGHGIDLTGTDSFNMENVSATSGSYNGQGGATPKTFVFQSRVSSGASVGNSRFQNCFVIGNWSVAAYYNYGAEDDEIVGGFWYNGYTTAAAATVLYTATNIKAQSSTFQTVSTGSQSCIDHKVIGGAFVNASSNAAADVFYLESITNLKFFGPWAACGAGGVGGRSLIYCDMSNGPSNLVHLFGFQGENFGGSANPSYGVCFSANTQTVVDWTFEGCYLPSNVNAIFGGAGVTLSSMFLINIAEAASHGLSVPNLTGSTIISTNMVINVTGTSCSGNLLVGARANMTLPNSNAVGTNVILDVAAGNVFAGGSVSMAGAASFGTLTGFGTPTGAGIISNFQGTAGTYTNAQLAGMISALAQQMKNAGMLSA